MINIKNIRLINGAYAEITYKSGEVEKFQCPFNAASIEDQLKDSKVVRMLKNDHADMIKLPPIAIPFYLYVIKTNGRIPSQESFLKAYIKFYSKTNNYVLEPISLPEENLIKDRIYRALPSFIRDFHFYAMCCNSNLFDHVEYDLYKDVKEDTDCILRKDGQEVKVSLFVNTRASQNWRAKKEGEGYEKDKSRVILTVDLESPNAVSNNKGDYKLFGQNHISSLSNVFHALKLFA